MRQDITPGRIRQEPPNGRQKGTINVRTDPQLHREFAAACALRGETIQDRISELMRSTVAETFAALRPNVVT